jgi:osmotically inducible protein OsmC
MSPLSKIGDGSIRSDDGLLDLKLALPRTLGGKGDATNPEQLFAGGHTACFENALFLVTPEARRHFADGNIEVVRPDWPQPLRRGWVCTVCRARRDYRGVDQKTGGLLVESAHAVCPYSNAIKGNVDVQIDLRASGTLDGGGCSGTGLPRSA